LYDAPRQEYSNLADKERRIVDRSEIADIFCVAISSGNVPALLEDFVSEQTTWAVVSGTGLSNSERDFLGIPGLRRLVEFCRERLKNSGKRDDGVRHGGGLPFCFRKDSRRKCCREIFRRDKFRG
jgi:hypothetical protein